MIGFYLVAAFLLGAAVSCLWLGGLLRGRATAEDDAYADGYMDGTRDAQHAANVGARWQG